MQCTRVGGKATKNSVSKLRKVTRSHINKRKDMKVRARRNKIDLAEVPKYVSNANLKRHP